MTYFEKRKVPSGDCICTAGTKLGVEIQAETYADNGYQMVGAPYYCDNRGLWVYELNKPKKTNKKTPFVKHSPDIGRNDPCRCGSNKKYKNCCIV